MRNGEQNEQNETKNEFVFFDDSHRHGSNYHVVTIVLCHFVEKLCFNPQIKTFELNLHNFRIYHYMFFLYTIIFEAVFIKYWFRNNASNCPGRSSKILDFFSSVENISVHDAIVYFEHRLVIFVLLHPLSPDFNDFQVDTTLGKSTEFRVSVSRKKVSSEGVQEDRSKWDIHWLTHWWKNQLFIQRFCQKWALDVNFWIKCEFLLLCGLWLHEYIEVQIAFCVVTTYAKEGRCEESIRNVLCGLALPRYITNCDTKWCIHFYIRMFFNAFCSFFTIVIWRIFVELKIAKIEFWSFLTGLVNRAFLLLGLGSIGCR